MPPALGSSLANVGRLFNRGEKHIPTDGKYPDAAGRFIKAANRLRRDAIGGRFTYLRGIWTETYRRDAQMAKDETVTDNERFEARLRTRLRELDKRLTKVERELDAPVDADFEESASEREGDEVLEGIGNAGLLEIKMINAALGRIEDGTFGTCVACGEPIAAKRLEAVPHAARCQNCA